MSSAAVVAYNKLGAKLTEQDTTKNVGAVYEALDRDTPLHPPLSGGKQIVDLTIDEWSIE